jgi:hypothetical protein
MEPQDNAYFFSRVWKTLCWPYFKKVQKNSHVIIILDVYDLILAFNDLTLLKEKKDNLLKKFEMVDLCEIQ